MYFYLFIYLFAVYNVGLNLIKAAVLKLSGI